MGEYAYSNSCRVVENKYDVIVVGGGTSGSTAAIAAAMEGANTLLIEKSCFLGGASSGGQVTPMMYIGTPESKDCSFVNSLIKKRLQGK